MSQVILVAEEDEGHLSEEAQTHGAPPRQREHGVAHLLWCETMGFKALVYFKIRGDDKDQTLSKADLLHVLFIVIGTVCDDEIQLAQVQQMLCIQSVEVPHSEVNVTVIGLCPRCKSSVYEGKKNYYCSNRDCLFFMWKNDRFFEDRKITFTPKIASTLLKDKKVKVKNIYSHKTGKTYNSNVVLCDCSMPTAP